MNVAGSCLAPGVLLTPTLTVPVLHSLRSLHSLNFDEHGEKSGRAVPHPGSRDHSTALAGS